MSHFRIRTNSTLATTTSLSMLKPLKSFIAQTALRHVQNLSAALDSIEKQKEVPRKLRAVLQNVAAWPSSYRSASEMERFFNFIDAVKSEVGRSLTRTEADQLIQQVYLVERLMDWASY